MSQLARYHDAYFQKIISLVPPELYRPKQDDENDVVANINESKYHKVRLSIYFLYSSFHRDHDS